MTGPQTPLWIKFAFLVYGGLLLFWLPIEDVSTRTPLLLSGGGAFLFYARYLWRATAHPKTTGWLHHSFAGLIAGFVVAPFATLMMVFKTGLHGHGFPDFSMAQLTAVLRLTPVLSAIGLAVSLLTDAWKNRRR